MRKLRRPMGWDFHQENNEKLTQGFMALVSQHMPQHQQDPSKFYFDEVLD
jgi:hypothetical protein